MKHYVHHPSFPWAVCAVAITILFLAFFPTMYVAGDEHQYYKNALLLQNGEIKSANPLLYCGGILKGENYLSNYHIGKSVSLIPFTWFPFPFILASGLIIHLLNMGIFALILRKLNIHTWMVALIAFYPALLWESRTLFSEAFTLSLLLGGLFFYLSKTPRSLFFSGLLFGLAALVRYETILISLSFGIAFVWKERHSILQWGRTPVPFFIGGGAVAAILLLAWNAWYNGSIFSTQLGSPGYIFATFPQPLFAMNFLLYVGILLLAFPLMLPLAARFQPLRLELALSTLFTLILFSQTANISVYPFVSPLTITGRMRYLIPVAGLLLVAYAGVLSSWIPRVTNRIGKPTTYRVAVLIGIFFLVGAMGLHYFHQDLVEKRAIVSDQLLKNTADKSLIIGSADDCSYFLPPLTGSRRYVKVNDPNQNIHELISQENNHVYIMQLQYANTSDSDVRQDVIDAERKFIHDFVSQNKEKLRIVFTTQSPHRLTIYEWTK